MPRKKGSGYVGQVRSLRLPLALERWFDETLCLRPDRTASALLLELIHGGLRLAPGYMRRHRDTLAAMRRDGEREGYITYIRALRETFGDRYVAHVNAWLEAETPEGSCYGIERDTFTRA